ncbi:MAG: hypothetical protein ACXV8Q_03450 [Methylobacter sp.]
MERISVTPQLFIALVAATFGPLILMPLSTWSGANTYIDTKSLIVLSVLVGSGHVAATLFFFFDRNAREIIKTDHHRLIIFPLILAVTFSLILNYSSSQSVLVLSTLNYIFLFYHYQKQNFGIISLINSGIPSESRPLLNCALFLPTAAGVITIEPTILQQLSGSSVSIKYLAASLYLCGSLAGLLYIIRYAEQLKPLTLSVIVAAILFFVPLWIYPDNRSASFGAFAAAHGAQYLVIMGFTSSGAGKVIMKLAFISAVIIGAIILEGFAQISLLGVTTGLTWGHFLIDARIWKMSRPDSRAYVASRLSSYIAIK